MNKILLLVTVSFLLNIATAQTGTNTPWTFVKGDTAIPLLPSYGTKGVPSALNQPGGRTGFVTGKDKKGNFWLFGGYRNQAFLNDLWKYDPTTNIWTWVSGDNVPGSDGVYGTKGVASPSNKPAGRMLAVAWMDSTDNLWVFGGEGYFNDLWKYNISTNEWTWMSGGSPTGKGNYGRLGVEAAGNQPGVRSRALGWSDISGNLWLFGGTGYDNNADASGELNDLWKYNSSTNAWTWVKGDSIMHGKAVYGTKGVAAKDNKPDARSQSVGWTDNGGTFWLFGGFRLTDTFPFRALSNDLWKYDPRTNEWTWVNGDSSYNVEGIYGLQGVSSPVNKPGARHSSISWKDNSGNFWLFGGAENE
ncbi:MAG TPA: kelch repeat-containing protein, partial [Segetibacter sp.]